MSIALLTIVLLPAASNGADDNFKGVAASLVSPIIAIIPAFLIAPVLRRRVAVTKRGAWSACALRVRHG